MGVSIHYFFFLNHFMEKLLKILFKTYLLYTMHFFEFKFFFRFQIF
jgi:hypothetical protein